MAGWHGRLETRIHIGAWETFKMEYVIQALDATLVAATVLTAYLAAEKPSMPEHVSVLRVQQSSA